jgi:hypothetical protein
MALRQTGLDVSLYTEHDTDAALHFLSNRIDSDQIPVLPRFPWSCSPHPMIRPTSPPVTATALTAMS